MKVPALDCLFLSIPDHCCLLSIVWSVAQGYIYLIGKYSDSVNTKVSNENVAIVQTEQRAV